MGSRWPIVQDSDRVDHMAEREFGENTLYNVVTNVIRVVAISLIGLLMVPFYIDQLGLSAYGIIPLAVSLAAYIMIFADSMGSSCARFTNIAIRNTNDASKEISTAFFGLLRICVIMLPLIILFSFVSPYIFKIGSVSASDVQIMFAMVISSSILTVLTSSVYGVFNATNKLYKLNIGRTLYHVSQVCFVIALFFISKPSLIYIGVAFMLSSIVEIVVLFWFAKRTYPEMKIRTEYYDKALFKEMSSLGKWNIMDKIGSRLYYPASLIIANIALSSYHSGGFALIVSMMNVVGTACYSITASMEPYIYTYVASDDYGKLRSVLTPSLKFISIMAAMPVAFIAIFSGDIIGAWVGNDLLFVSGAVTIAILGHFSYCVMMVIDDVPVATKNIDKTAVFTLAFGIANIIFGIIVVMLTDFGLWGIATVCAVSTTVYSVVKILMIEKFVEEKRFRFARQLLIGAFLIVVCSALFYCLSFTGIVYGSWLSVIPVFVVLFAIYSVIAFKLLMTAEEKKMSSYLVPEFVRKAIPFLFR